MKFTINGHDILVGEIREENRNLNMWNSENKKKNIPRKFTSNSFRKISSTILYIHRHFFRLLVYFPLTERDGCVHIPGGLLYQKCALVIESDLFFLGGPQEKYFIYPKPRIPGFPTKDVLGMVVNPLDALTKNGGRVLLHHALLQSHGVFLLFDWRVLGSRTVCLFLCCTWRLRRR